MTYVSPFISDLDPEEEPGVEALKERIKRNDNAIVAEENRRWVEVAGNSYQPHCDRAGMIEHVERWVLEGNIGTVA